MGRATGHETGGEGADVGAIAVEADAGGHHFYVRLGEAGGGAVFAGGDAGIERVEQRLVLSVHGGGFGVMEVLCSLGTGPLGG